MRRHVPDPGTETAVLARRLDTAETQLATLDTITTDTAALARGLADLTEQVRALTRATTTGAIRAAGTGTHSPTDEESSAPGTAPDLAEGQPDWLAVSDPGTAAEWLADAATFVQDILTPLGAAPAMCWPLHPAAVVEILALREEHRAAYTGGSPTPVSEWLSRWLPSATARIREALSTCAAERGHRHNARTYEVPHLDLARVATWWTDTHGHNPDAVEAFAMAHID